MDARSDLKPVLKTYVRKLVSCMMRRRRDLMLIGAAKRAVKGA